MEKIDSNLGISRLIPHYEYYLKKSTFLTSQSLPESSAFDVLIDLQRILVHGLGGIN